MENFKEHPARKTSGKSLNDLVNLILKINAKILEKMAPAQKGKGIRPPGKTDVVIIVLSSQEEKASPLKPRRLPKGQAGKGDWIQDLCDEIERGPRT